MARISNLGAFNTFRQERREAEEILRFDNDSDEVVYVHKNDVRGLLTKYIEEDLNYFAENTSDNIKRDFRDRVNLKLQEIETSLNAEISRQFDRIAERIVLATTDRIIEAEVNRRVDEKLQKLKKLL